MKQSAVLPSMDLDEVINSDYILDMHVPRKVKGMVQGILKELSALKKTMEIKSVRVGYVCGLNWVATYIAESRENAIILLNVSEHIRVAEGTYPYESVLYECLKSSLVHEMGHAYLDSKGLETYQHDEDVVEEFARDYCDDGDDAKSLRILNSFLKRS
jgi:hypothetical protein